MIVAVCSEQETGRVSADGRFEVLGGGRWLSSEASALGGYFIGTRLRSGNAPPQGDKYSCPRHTFRQRGSWANEGRSGGDLFYSEFSLAQSLSHLHSFTPSSLPPPSYSSSPHFPILSPPIRLINCLSLKKSLFRVDPPSRRSIVSPTLVLLPSSFRLFFKRLVQFAGVPLFPPRSVVPETTTTTTYLPSPSSFLSPSLSSPPSFFCVADRCGCGGSAYYHCT